MDILTDILQELDIEPKQVQTVPALTLAYLGDCIYELVIRTMLVEKGIAHVSELNKAAVGFVKASAQKEMYFAVEEELSEEEIAAFKRGRNVRSSGVPKNASVNDYRIATGYEAMLGYLYASGKSGRVVELVKKGAAARRKNDPEGRG